MPPAVKNERIALWDNLRLILIFLVVLGHLADRYTGESEYLRMLYLFIYTFHMPAFVFISGLFCKKAVDSKNYTAIFSYFLLYIVLKVIIGVADFLESGEVRFFLLKESNVPWYALALFAFCMVTVFLRRFKVSYVMAFGIILACFAGFDNKTGDTLALMRIAVFYPFFFAGYALDAQRVSASVKKLPLKIISFLLFAALAAGVYFGGEKAYELRPLLTGRNQFEALDEFADLGVLLRLIYYPVAFLLIFALIAITPSKRIPLLTVMGSRTVQVYALHILFINLLYCLVNMDAVMARLLPAAPRLLIVPLAAAITAACSLKVFGRLFSVVLHPPLKKE